MEGNRLYRIKVSSHLVLERRTSYKDSDLEDLDRAACRVKNGDYAAFDTVDKLLRSHILRMSFKYEITSYDRDDLVQDMMIEAFMMCFRYDYERGHFMNYALRSIRFKMYNKIVVNPGAWNSWEPLLETIFDSTHSDALAGIHLKERAEDYLSAVESLSTREKYVLKLFLERYSVQEIASILKCGLKSVKNTVHRLKIKFGEVEDLHSIVDNNASNRYSILELK